MIPRHQKKVMVYKLVGDKVFVPKGQVFVPETQIGEVFVPEGQVFVPETQTEEIFVPEDQTSVPETQIEKFATSSKNNNNNKGNNRKEIYNNNEIVKSGKRGKKRHQIPSKQAMIRRKNPLHYSLLQHFYHREKN